MKRYLLKTILLVLLSCQTSHAQIFLRAYNYRPTGEYGFVFKPGFSAEIGYMPEFEDDSWVRVCFSATYKIMKPRMDVFPVYAVMHSNTTLVLPGEQKFTKYNELQLFGGIDVAVVKKEKLFFYIGTDIIIGAASVDYTAKYETYKDESYSGGGYIVGGRFRLGMQYDVTENIGIIAHANRLGFLVSEPASINWCNDYGIGIRYQFN